MTWSSSAYTFLHFVCILRFHQGLETWTESEHQIFCQTPENDNGDSCLRQWSNELGEGFWVPFTFQEGQSASEGCWEVGSPSWKLLTSSTCHFGTVQVILTSNLKQAPHSCQVRAQAPDSWAGSSSTGLGWRKLHVEDHHWWQELGQQLRPRCQTAVFAVAIGFFNMTKTLAHFLACNNSVVAPHLPPHKIWLPAVLFLFLKIKFKLKGRCFDTLPWIADGAWHRYRTGSVPSVAGAPGASEAVRLCMRGLLWRGWRPDLNQVCFLLVSELFERTS